MDPIVRRSSFYYVTSALTYLAIMGRYLLTRDWTAFEVIPLFMPIWMISALLASEDDERYAFLRTLPVPDVDVVRRKFGIILSSAAGQWGLMTAVAALRMGDGISEPATLVYLTCVGAFALLLVAGCQIAIWRYGVPAMKPVLIASIVAGIALAIIHLASMKHVADWPVLSRLSFMQWLGGASWLWSALIAALALVAFRALLPAGVRVKTASEAHL